MKALILVDIQNDFLPTGALPVPAGAEVIPIARRLALEGRFDLVLATQDWHPPDHLSFASNHPSRAPYEVMEIDGLEQVLWPDHCVQGSFGAEFAAGFPLERIDAVFRKGTDPRIDSYSGFFDNAYRKSTGLGDYLREREVTDLYVAGLATDYCVLFTALDAQGLGFRTHLVVDGCRGVDLQPGNVARARARMREAGIEETTSAALIGRHA